MANVTYEPIATQTLTSSTTTVTFSSIPQTYTDLVIIMVHKNNAGATAADGFIRFNSDTGSNYSNTRLLGVTPNYAQSARTSNATCIQWMFDDNSVYDVTRFNIMNYANTTTYKTFVMRQDQGNYGTAAQVGLWRSTAAIDTISLTSSDNLGSGTADQFVAGSTFTLYGIASASAPTPKATGGTITYDIGYTYHTFTSSGTFTPLQSLSADILVVAGGGGTSWLLSAGGGAGGVCGFASQSLTTSPYTVTVGAGGAGLSSTTIGRGSDGSNSQFGSLTAAVGGGAAGYYTNDYADGAPGNPGGSGGGGGTQGNHAGGSGAGGSGTSGQGYNGGNGAGGSSIDGGGGGGGGAGAAGTNGYAGGDGGNGGNGATYNTSVGGSAGPYSFINAMGAATSTGQLVSGNYYYAGGGGGGTQRGNGGAGGYGGGGTGSNSSTTPTNGTANTGGGGGGQRSNNVPAQSGGSGIVIVRYAN